MISTRRISRSRIHHSLTINRRGVYRYRSVVVLQGMLSPFQIAEMHNDRMIFSMSHNEGMSPEDQVKAFKFPVSHSGVVLSRFLKLVSL
jgi:hypothetical protein